MAKLPNGERAIIDPGKLAGYALDPEHDRGGHKARVFKAALGWTAADSATLEAELRLAALSSEAVLSHTNIHGMHHIVDFEVQSDKRAVNLRSRWTVRDDEDFPRLTSVWVRRESTE